MLFMQGTIILFTDCSNLPRFQFLTTSGETELALKQATYISFK